MFLDLLDESFAKLLAASVHWQDRPSGSAAHDQVATLTGFEDATPFDKPPLELSARHGLTIQQFCLYATEMLNKDAGEFRRGEIPKTHSAQNSRLRGGACILEPRSSPRGRPCRAILPPLAARSSGKDPAAPMTHDRPSERQAGPNTRNVTTQIPLVNLIRGSDAAIVAARSWRTRVNTAGDSGKISY